MSGLSLDVRVEVVRCQSFLSAEGTEGLALTSGSRICSPGINCSDLRLVGVFRTSFLFSITVLYFTFISIPTSSSSCSSSSTVLNVRFKKSTTAASYFAGCFRRCCTCADPENLGELWSRIREISFATLSRRIWRPPFSAFQVLHFRGTFEGGSSRSWSRGRAQPPPCAVGNGPAQSGPPIHPVHLLL